jgi:hypothetical protein
MWLLFGTLLTLLCRLVEFLPNPGSKITALVLCWVGDSVVRSDSRGFGVADQKSLRAKTAAVRNGEMGELT